VSRRSISSMVDQRPALDTSPILLKDLPGRRERVAAKTFGVLALYRDAVII